MATDATKVVLELRYPSTTGFVEDEPRPSGKHASPLRRPQASAGHLNCGQARNCENEIVPCAVDRITTWIQSAETRKSPWKTALAALPPDSQTEGASWQALPVVTSNTRSELST
jgi:hypothetical protein